MTTLSDDVPYAELFGNLPKAYVRRVRADSSGEALPEEWLRWYRLLHKKSPVVHRGLTRVDGERVSHLDRPHRNPAAACFFEDDCRVSWGDAAQLVSASGPFVRVHGPGIGEPGILIPASSGIVYGNRCRRSGPLTCSPVRPGRHSALFFGTPVPDTAGYPPAPCLTGRSHGVVIAAILAGRYVRQGEAEYRFPRLPIIEFQDGSRIEHLAGESVVFPNGILASVLSRIDRRGDIPVPVRESGRSFMEGFVSYAFGRGDVRTSNMQRASDIYRLLCLAGYGGELTVNVGRRFVRIHRAVSAKSFRFRSVRISPASVSQVLLVPQTDVPLVHMSGLVFLPHML